MHSRTLIADHPLPSFGEMSVGLVDVACRLTYVARHILQPLEYAQSLVQRHSDIRIIRQRIDSHDWC